MCIRDRKSTVFKGTSKTIQNELLDCILEVCRDEIRAEIKPVSYTHLILEHGSHVWFSNPIFKYPREFVYMTVVNNVTNIPKI